MSKTGRLPSTDWPTLLRRAPHFSSVIMDELCDTDPSAFAPHVRAIYHFDMFDAQVSSGGVAQYFDNVLAHRTDAARIPEYIAQNAMFTSALPLIEEVHAIWSARQASLAFPTERLEALTQAFRAIHYEIRQRLEADIVRSPHRYFSIATVPGLRGKGIEHVALDEGTHRLRFEDGFPVGPNILETEDGNCDVISFSRDRTLVQAETSGLFGGRERRWIHFPSMASGRWSFGALDNGRSTRTDSRALGLRTHGLNESFHADGRLERASLHWHGEELCSEWFYADGTVQLRRQRRDEGEHWLRYWPNGTLNTESFKDAEGRTHYLRCLDADGHDLAPNGTGRLIEMLSLDDGVRQWREGDQVNGFLHGPVRRLTSRPDGSKARETECTVYRNGRPE
ncbi:TPA: hypothetical protein NIB08_000797 [Pseudomonas aeruginosa]|nr:hypothetical protein [Pseudomonas aeruginosa]HCE7043642.1 hypothetical protein [Pseudomonas aeruginosa]HCE7539297.1 hypothetical protein [Pseudomonas aeruginosa]HCE9725918.1 hypothetical protein [Pseudomonas aeruginosa]HCE9807267.1 hypothetical protein [Pseudomonas aeruginosa]